MYNILKRPIITEKNTLQVHLQNEYAFEVPVSANRTEIKQAVEKLFKVKVLRVNTLVCRKSSRKLGRVPGERKLWKKAIVKLKEGDKLDFVAS
jgi:large subunit ribosomal protein L23